MTPTLSRKLATLSKRAEAADPALARALATVATAKSRAARTAALATLARSKADAAHDALVLSLADDEIALAAAKALSASAHPDAPARLRTALSSGRALDIPKPSVPAPRSYNAATMNRHRAAYRAAVRRTRARTDVVNALLSAVARRDEPASMRWLLDLWIHGGDAKFRALITPKLLASRDRAVLTELLTAALGAPHSDASAVLPELAAKFPAALAAAAAKVDLGDARQKQHAQRLIYTLQTLAPSKSAAVRGVCYALFKRALAEPALRKVAMDVLVQLDGFDLKPLVGPLVDAAAESQNQTRAKAAFLLACTRSPRAVPTLLEVIDARVALIGAWTPLSQWRQPRLLPALERRFARLKKGSVEYAWAALAMKKLRGRAK